MENPKPNKGKIIAVESMIGISNLIVDFLAVNGVIKAVIPKIKRMFRVFVPTMFPMESSALPFMAAERETAVSGILVPWLQL